MLKETQLHGPEVGGNSHGNGQVRPHTPPGTPTPGPEEGWQSTDIISATLVFRGPGWRLLNYKLLCCTK